MTLDLVHKPALCHPLHWYLCPCLFDQHFSARLSRQQMKESCCTSPTLTRSKLLSAQVLHITAVKPNKGEFSWVIGNLTALQF